MPLPMPDVLPKGARTALDSAKRSYGSVRRHGPRGSAVPSPEYLAARLTLQKALRRLRDLGVRQQVVADELGISRSAVSQWTGKA